MVYYTIELSKEDYDIVVDKLSDKINPAIGHTIRFAKEVVEAKKLWNDVRYLDRKVAELEDTIKRLEEIIAGLEDKKEKSKIRKDKPSWLP